MRPFHSSLFAALLLVLLSAACASQNPFAVTAPTAQPTATPVAIVPDTGLFANQQPNVVNKPQLGLGAAYRYFDGSLLDAVPNSGAFLMGAINGGDNPQHRITVSDFWIYSTEVSNQMYAWCVSLGKCTPPNGGDDPLFHDPATVNYPVVGVTWQQASDYCGFAHGRLPTEAEWEKAADWDASNQIQLIFPWGNQNASCDLLNFKYCVGHATQILQYGQGRSFYGVYNLEGNVAEWVQDWYAPGYYQKSPAQDPSGPSTGSARVIRGSAWDSDARYASPTVRLWASPTSHRNSLGFRCVVPDPSYYAPYCTQPVSYGVNAAGSSLQQCSDPGVQDLQGCAGPSHPIDLVTIIGNNSTTVTVSGLEGCTPGNNDLGVKHTCPAGVTIKVNTKCSTAASGSPSCPPNYQQDPNNPLQCTSPGAPGTCPAGFSYDSSLQCCSIRSGSNVAAQPCAAGQHLFNGACVLDSSGLQQPHTITFKTGQVACVAGPLGVGVTVTPAHPTPTNPPTLPPPPTSTPLPTLPLPTFPFPTFPPPPTNTLGPSNTPGPTNTPFPTHTPKPTRTPKLQATDTPAALPTQPPPPTDTQGPPPIDTPAPQPTATTGAGLLPQIVAVPLYIPVVGVAESSIEPIYAIGGTRRR